MNDHNLDDLIIDDAEPKSSKFKGVLTITALIAIMLILGIVFSKIVLKDPDEGKNILEENNTEMISPELTLQSTPEIESMPEPDTNTSSIDEAIAKSFQSEENTTTTKVEELVKETVEIDDKKVVQEVTEETVKNTVATTTVTATSVAVVETVKKKPSIQKPTTPKKSTKPTKPSKPKATYSNSHYIQVGSFSKTPSKRFLSIIRNSGFKYKITPRAANGNKRLLIGPYRSKQAAHNALPAVKELINKSAFVVKK